jgi:hypothetical protein
VQIGCEKALVDIDGRARLSGAEEPVLSKFARVVIDHTIVSGNKVPANFRDLCICGRTMKPGRNQDRDRIAGNACIFDLTQENRKDLPVRHWPRDIAHRDGG